MTTVSTAIVGTPPNIASLYKIDGTVAFSVTPFATAIPGGIRVAQADLNGDGAPELIAATGPGVPTQVVIFDGTNHTKISTFAPFEAGFTGGVFVTAGDLTGDFKPELVITPDEGGGPRVRVFTGTNFVPLADFYGIEDPNFRGGARAAIGDMTGDGIGELVVAAGAGGGPRVSIWDGASLANGKFTTHPIGDFFLFESTLRNGLYPALGDVNADGRADLIVGAGPDGGPRLLVLSGRVLIENNGLQQPLANFFVGNSSRRDGLPVAATDLDGDGRADVITGGGRVGTVTGFLGKNLSTSAVGNPDFQFVPFATWDGGVYVG